jgi:phosphoglycerol transferase
MNNTSFTGRRAWTWVLIAGIFGICAWLGLRAIGTHPSIFADEWYYSKLSRLQPLGESMIPSYLYLWLFRATSACGDQFYDCAHIGNVIFFGASAPFVYLIARQVAGRALSVLLALLSLLAPLNIYTAFFMPEAMYYFGFCVLSWVALTRTHWHWAAHAAAAGIVLGLMSLVKVHGLFLAPALAVFLLYARWAEGGRWVVTGLMSVAVALACLCAVKFGLGYLLAGETALHLFGNFYQGAANSAGHRGLFSLLPAAFINARGHLMALAMLAPLPLALIAMSLLRRPRREQAGPGQHLQLYALLMLGAAAGLTILYTASIANPGVTIEGLRLHLRYYSFVFPLLWLVAAAALGRPPEPGRAALRWTLALLLVAVLVAAWFKLPTYTLSPIDGPDIAALDLHTLAGRIMLVLELAVLLLWAMGRRQALPLFLFVALPATLAIAGVDDHRVVMSNHIEGPAEHAIAAARRLVPPAERGLVTLVGSDISTLMRAQFNLDNADATLVMLEGDAPVEQYQLPVRNKWLLVLGQHQLPGALTPVAQTAEYTLLHMDMHHHKVGYADMHQPFGTGIVASAEGLSHSEPWGRWSDSKQVVLHLSRPLPRHARVILKALAYDVNTELPFTMRVGSSSERFRLGWMMQDVGLVFDTDGNTRDLVIDVPRPLAPIVHGQPDDRTLGICIADIEIGEREPDQIATN